MNTLTPTQTAVAHMALAVSARHDVISNEWHGFDVPLAEGKVRVWLEDPEANVVSVEVFDVLDWNTAGAKFRNASASAILAYLETVLP